MSGAESILMPFMVALGIGLLIGLERERRKGEGPARSAAGIRTFAIASLLGAVSVRIGGDVFLAVAAAGVIGLAAVSYDRNRDDDPGLTTEIALVLTLALGGLAMREPGLAAALSAVVAILLAARAPLHRFVRDVLTEVELRDALILAAATLIVWPLLPDRYLGPFNAINPSKIWTIVILLMAIGAGGHVAVRALGARFGREDAAFSVKTTLVLAAILSVVLIGAAALLAWLGQSGVLIAATVAGLADVHAAAIAAGSQVANGNLSADQAVRAILLGFTSNSITKIILAATAGTREFAARVVPGILFFTLAAWVSATIGRLQF